MTLTGAPLLPGIRLLRVTWRMLPALFLAANVVAWPWLLGASDSIKEQAIWVGLTLIGFRLVSALVSEILSPHRPGLRVLPMSDTQAARMATVVRGLLYVLLGSQIAIYLIRQNGWNESIAELVELVRRTGLVLFTGLVVARTGILAKIDVSEVSGYLGLLRRLFVRLVFPVGLLALVVVTFVMSLGYVAMGRWIGQRVLGSLGAILAVTIVATFLKRRLRRTVAFIEAHEDEVENEVPDEQPTAEAPVEEEPDDDKDDEDDDLMPAPVAATGARADPVWIGVERLSEGGLTVIAILFTVGWLMSIWGLEAATLKTALGTQIVPGWGPTYGAILSSLLYFGTTLLIGRALATVLIFMVFPRAGVDAGARYAILAILRYIVYFTAGYLGFSAIGFDTSALTVFAGAFGVAVAFGLQDVFGNFLSGLIMLIERPVRVGDLIDVGGEMGRVEAIRLRGTTIRTHEGTTIIIPNSQMLGERLKNISHDMAFARVQVPVGVSYGTNPRRLQRLLLRSALRDPRVLREPRPFVRFEAFGDSSLNFMLNCYTAPDDRWSVRSDLHTAIFEMLAQEGIEIPFPQRDLHIRSDARAAGPSRDGAAPAS